LALVIALTFASAGPGEAAGPIKVGFSLPKTGLFAGAGPSQLNAYELWRQQVNARGGLDVKGERRRVDFVVYDDQSDPGLAVRIYEKLITDDKVDLLLAPWGTPHHFAVAGVLERYKFPMVGNSAASVQLREIKPGYIWFPTTAMPDRMAVELTALLRKASVRTVALQTLQLPFSLEMKKFLLPQLEKAGIKVAVNHEYPPGIKDMTVMLTAVKDARPDAILSLSYPEDSVQYLKQAKELGVTAPFQFVLIGPTMDFFGKMFGPAADGLVTVGHWSPHQSKWPRGSKFFKSYLDTFKERPDYLDSALAYTSCEILEQAVAKAGLDKAKLREAIASGSFDTINGPVRFKGVENSTTPTAFLQLQGGEAQLIWPAAVATSSYRPKAPWSAK
jgi:branched-chain amino acid transport system substrate-binding protein